MTKKSIKTVPLTIEVPIPKKVWICNDCGTISDFYKRSFECHRGCVGQVSTAKPGFEKKYHPELAWTGEIVWVKNMGVNDG